MAFDSLTDFRTAVRTYLDEKVALEIKFVGEVGGGTNLIKGESFDFELRVKNANRSAGGLVVTNIRYVLSGNRVEIFAPHEHGEVLDSDGNVVNPPTGSNQPGRLTSLILRPTEDTGTGDPRSLNPDDFESFKMRGIATQSGAGSVTAAIEAAVDVSDLFPVWKASEESKLTLTIGSD